jgi:hypothetical protein
MNWNDFKRHANDGIQTNTFRDFHHAIVKCQIQWIAALGYPRWHFLLITALGLPLAIFSYWIAGTDGFSNPDLSNADSLTVFLWYFISTPIKMMQFIYPFHLFVALITGAFFKEFWVCVNAQRKIAKDAVNQA